MLHVHWCIDLGLAQLGKTPLPLKLKPQASRNLALVLGRIVLVALSDSAREVLVLVNRQAGASYRRSAVEQLIRELLAERLEVTVIDDISQLAAESLRRHESGRLRAVVAAGGDGTIRLAAETIPHTAPIAIFPLGTENLLARYFQLSARPSEAAKLIAGGTAVRIDAGLANGRLFSLVAGCGFDAHVVRQVHQGRKGNIQHWSYVKPILTSIRTYEYPLLRVRYAPASAPAGGELSAELTARWVFVVNLPRYAGGLNFAPGASAADGLLDVCTFKHGSLWSGLGYLASVFLGRHERLADFVRVQTRHLQVTSALPAPYQLDGDSGGELPLEAKIAPARMTLVISPKWLEQANDPRLTSPQPSL